MEKILFFIKRKKLLKDGTAPIFVRVSCCGVSSEISTGKSVLSTQWITAKGRVRGNNLAHKQLNNFLDQMEYKLHDISLELQREGKQVSGKEILSRYKGKSKPIIGVIELYSEHNDELKQLLNNGVTYGTLERHETSMRLFKEFIGYKYHVSDLPVNNVTVDVLRSYQVHLMSVRKNCNNTAVKYLKNLGKILNIAVTRNIIPSSPLSLLPLKLQPVDKGFLTKEELTALKNKDFELERLSQVRDVFLFCCYTGLAYIDVSHLTSEDLCEEDGIVWIRKPRQKTNVVSSIPLLTPAIEILNKYAHIEKRTGKLLPVCSNQKMNAYLKEIAALTGIKKELTTHLARHTFATTVTLANNVSIENVSKMLGHSSIKMTQHYARILDDSIKREMIELDTKL